MLVTRRGLLKLCAAGLAGSSVAALTLAPKRAYAYTFTGSSNSHGSWSFVRQWKTDGGFRQIGPVRYKVDRLQKRYQRTQYRTDSYEQLTVVLG
jgi:hypothetical protein